MNNKLTHKIPALLLALVMLLASGCTGNVPEAPELHEPAGMEPDNAVVTRGEIYNVTTCEGLVLPRVHELSFTAGGVINEVAFGVGSPVKAGDVLARLDAGMYESALAAAKEGLEYSSHVWALTEKKVQAQIDIARLELKQLCESGASEKDIGLKEIDIAELENQLAADKAIWELSLAESENNIATLEAQVAGSVLTAPCDGTLVYSAAVEGGYAMAGAGLFWVAEDAELYISADYISSDDVNKALGIYATVAGKEIDVAYEAMDRVEYISRSDSGKKMTSTFSIADAGDVTVESGMSAVIFLLTEYETDALIVPTCAVRMDNSGYFVYLVDENGAQVRQSVKRGIYNDAYVQIVEGLEEGDVVYAGN